MKPSLLWHFSEDPGIRIFDPRPAVTDDGAPSPPLWAVDDDHAPLYYFPRDCPRVGYWATARTTAQDRERFLGLTAAKRVVAVEGAWLERIRSASLYRYALPFESFDPLYEIGVYRAREAVKPLFVEPVGDLLARLRDAGVELRLTPSIWPLHDALLEATLQFTMIRMRNAAVPQPEGHSLV